MDSHSHLHRHGGRKPHYHEHPVSNPNDHAHEHPDADDNMDSYHEHSHPNLGADTIHRTVTYTDADANPDAGYNTYTYEQPKPDADGTIVYADLQRPTDDTYAACHAIVHEHPRGDSNIHTHGTTVRKNGYAYIHGYLHAHVYRDTGATGL